MIIAMIAVLFRFFGLPFFKKVLPGRLSWPVVIRK